MTSIRLKYVKQFVDRHGRPRFYLRRPGCKLVPLPGLPGSTEFMEAYAQTIDSAPRVEIGASRTRAGSVAAAVVGYFGTAAFHNLAPRSQQEYRRILEGLRREHGERAIGTLERRHVVMMLDAKAKTPIAARSFLRCLRLLIQYAIGLGLRQDDPTAGVRVRVPRSEGHVTWSDEDVAVFETHYPLDSKPRLALALLLNTAARVSDAVRLGRQHVRNGALQFSQQKTGRTLQIPISRLPRSTLPRRLNI